SPYNIPADFPLEIRVSDGPQVTRVIRDGSVFQVNDSEGDTRITPVARSLTRALGARAFLMVPLRRDQESIGALTVLRAARGAFSAAQIELLKTFADQAVIAVENARLLAELRTRNTDLTESLARQTATGEILRAIAASPSDVQPVFDAIARNSLLLCSG